MQYREIYSSARLPSIYQEVEYIESTGTQYIATGYTPSSNNFTAHIKCLTHTVASDTNASFFGARTTDNWDLLYNVCSSGWEIGSNGYTRVDNAVQTEIIYDMYLTITDSTQTLISNGTQLFSVSKSNRLTTAQNVYLFGVYDKGSVVFPMNGRIYACTFWENGIAVRNFIPCYVKSSGVIGMYDLVTDTFLTNIGTGTFGKGSDWSQDIIRIQPEWNTVHQVMQNGVSAGGEIIIDPISVPSDSTQLSVVRFSFSVPPVLSLPSTWKIDNKSDFSYDEAGTYEMILTYNSKEQKVISTCNKFSAIV